MKITKRAKKVNVQHEEVITYRSRYRCPTCKTTFNGFVAENITRFICECGQELAIEKHTITENENR